MRLHAKAAPMTITIRHLDGPLAGQEQQFDDSVEVILFGRSPECQVIYPPEYSIVGRKHFQLRRTGPNAYATEMLGPYYVEVDGLFAESGAPIISGSVIRLGRLDGPSFKIEIPRNLAKKVSVEAEHELGPSFKLEIPRHLAKTVSVEAEPELGSRSPVSSYEPEPMGAKALDLAALFRERAWAVVATTGLPYEEIASAIPAPAPSAPWAGAPNDHAPRAQMAMRRSTGIFWWVALVLGAAAAGYLLYRREIVLGSAVGKLLHATMPSPPAAKDTTTDLVDVSVFGPTVIEAGRDGLIQVFLHTLGQREIAKALAQETDPDATRRGVQTLAAEIAQGQRVEIILEGRGLGVDQERQTLVWRGEPCACQFTVSAPKDFAGRAVHPRVIVMVNSVPVGSLTFAMKVTQEKTEAGSVLRGDRARRYSYAFLSYAAPDRAEVIKRAQGLKAGGTDFFNDLLSLEPGERWEKRLYQEIDRCDVFYLFWSSQAKASEWVMKEIEHALARHLSSETGDPDIIPVIIEGPPPPSPPESLKDIHFNDSLIYVLAGMPDGPSVSGT